MPNPISVVIPSWQGASILPPTLAALSAQQGVEFEVLVVDHGRANRDTEELMKQYSEFTYIGEDLQLGYTGAVNRGVAAAKYSRVLVLCNDVSVRPGALVALSQAYQNHSLRGSAPILFAKVYKIDEPLKLKANFWFRFVNEESSAYFFPDGSAFLFDRDVYGLPFDGSYFTYQEDVYLGWRARLMGNSIQRVIEAEVDNWDGGTTKRTKPLTAFYTERNRWINYCIFLSLPSLLFAMPLLIFDFFIKIGSGRNRLAKLKAIGWIFFHFNDIWRKRRQIQKTRRVSDRVVLAPLSGTWISGDHYFMRVVNFPLRVWGRVFLGLGS